MPRISWPWMACPINCSGGCPVCSPEDHSIAHNVVFRMRHNPRYVAIGLVIVVGMIAGYLLASNGVI